jgi:hypothetical protein
LDLDKKTAISQAVCYFVGERNICDEGIALISRGRLGDVVLDRSRGADKAGEHEDGGYVQWSVSWFGRIGHCKKENSQTFEITTGRCPYHGKK